MLPIGDQNPLVHIRSAYVNHALIVACVVVFVLQLGADDGLVLAFALYPGLADGSVALPAFAADTPHVVRLVTYAFLHGGFLHLAGNMVTLWVFGDNVEDALGHRRYLLFFVLCAAAGGLAETALSTQPDIPVIGASGAVCGVMGAYLLMHPNARVLVLVGFRVPVAVPASVFVGLTILVNVVMALSGDVAAQVAWIAHLGGFAAGMILLPLLRYNDVPLFNPAEAYPESARFPFLNRLHFDLTPRGRSRAGQVFVALKTAAFFVLVVVLVETFVP